MSVIKKKLEGGYNDKQCILHWGEKQHRNDQWLADIDEKTRRVCLNQLKVESYNQNFYVVW